MRSVLISGGGTGGHIYPALAIADEIKRRHPACTIRFVGAEGRMEMEKVPAAGYPIDGLWITGIERKIFSKKNLLFPFRLISSLRKSARLLSAYRPDAVVGVGGFASGPLLYAATKRRIPTLIQEQNSYPGITNKLLAKRVDAICTGFPDMARWFPKERSTHTGNPLRNSIAQDLPQREAAAAHFGFEADKPVVFIMGGSLGAHSINQAVKEALRNWEKEGLSVLWQCGQRYEDSLKAWLKDQGIQGVHLCGFITRMDYAYACSDLIISRAGAMSIAELAQVGKAALFVPSPNVAEDHQTWNARSLTDQGAAILVRDQDVSADLGERVLELMCSKEERINYGERIKSFARPNAAAAVVDELEKLLRP